MWMDEIWNIITRYYTATTTFTKGYRAKPVSPITVRGCFELTLGATLRFKRWEYNSMLLKWGIFNASNRKTAAPYHRSSEDVSLLTDVRVLAKKTKTKTAKCFKNCKSASIKSIPVLSPAAPRGLGSKSPPNPQQIQILPPPSLSKQKSIRHYTSWCGGLWDTWWRHRDGAFMVVGN